MSAAPAFRRLRRRLDRFFPPGFRVMAGVAGLLVALGAAQLGALAVRDEPYPLAAAALALLLGGGGAALAAFVRRNVRQGTVGEEPGARVSPAGALTAIAVALIAAEAIALFWTTSTFFPLRMTLLWRGPIPADRILVATGRRARVTDFGLERLDLTMNGAFV